MRSGREQNRVQEVCDMAMTVLSVGQCVPDDMGISAVVQKELGATLERAGSAEEAKKMMEAKKYDLVLVNRVFDADGDSGVRFIGQRMMAGERAPMMLVSNYEDAQADAMAAGAFKGFGKSAMGNAEAGKLLRAAAGGKR